jgi:hypothetical protein
MSEIVDSTSISDKGYEPIPEVKGDILPEYVNGDFKLSMWVPADMGNALIIFSFLRWHIEFF